MPLVSVKLSQQTKEQVAQLAAQRGMTAHALMVQAIEATVQNTQRYDQFVQDALQARDQVLQSGMVYDGAAFATYLRAKVRGDAHVAKPALQTLVTP